MKPLVNQTDRSKTTGEKIDENHQKRKEEM